MAFGTLRPMNPSDSEQGSSALRAILAANLDKLRRHDSPGDELLSVRAWALRRGLNVRAIDRLLGGEHAITLDKLDEIAGILELQAWQLLLPDFDPARPAEAPITEAERLILKRLRHLIEKP